MWPIVVPFGFDGIITWDAADFDTLAAFLALILAAGGLGRMLWCPRR